jgi:hypothetical protein
MVTLHRGNGCKVATSRGSIARYSNSFLFIKENLGIRTIEKFVCYTIFFLCELCRKNLGLESGLMP